MKSPDQSQPDPSQLAPSQVEAKATHTNRLKSVLGSSAVSGEPAGAAGLPIRERGIGDRISAAAAELVALGFREIVIVDPDFDQYGDFVAAASEGVVGLHFCNDGLSALKLARRFRGDIWLVSTELPDMSGFDLLPILLEHVHQGGVDPLRNGPRISLDSIGSGFRAGVFMVSDLYRLEEEQRSLASGSSGYLVRPITLDLVKALREPGLGSSHQVSTRIEASVVVDEGEVRS